MLIANYPGIYVTTPPSSESEFGVYWPALLPAKVVDHVVVTHDGETVPIPHTEGGRPPQPIEPPSVATVALGGETVRRPLGTVFGARSGDKGGNANVGVWARSDAAYAWLAEFLTVERFRALVPEAATLEVRRFELANLRSLNFVVVGILGEGVASTTRGDRQAKSLGEYLRSRVVDLPKALLEPES
jgi:hypothetical protein